MGMIKNVDLIKNLKFQIKELNSQITYHLSVKQRMEQERKYINDDSCRVMMSCMDRKVLQEIHVPMVLDHDLSLKIIDTSVKHCTERVKSLKEKANKLRAQVEELEKEKSL